MVVDRPGIQVGCRIDSKMKHITNKLGRAWMGSGYLFAYQDLTIERWRDRPEWSLEQI